MKSAFDLVLERSGGALEELTEKQKDEIAEFERRRKAKVTEAEMSKDERLVKALGDSMQSEQILKDFAVEIASINSKCESLKSEIREKK